jgi:hypothetical protein
MKLVPALLLVTLSGCAWSNPANRPLWSSFEKHLVPEQDAAFYASLPLTVPAGLVAVLLDALLVHPVQVTDDAAGDAADLWRELHWREEYYTELGFLPLRALGTPVVFVGSWFGRSLFDIEPRESRDPAVRAAALAAVAGARRAEWLAFFAALEQGAAAPKPPAAPPVEWDDELGAAFDHAHRTLGARGRFDLLCAAKRLGLQPWLADPWLGLRDPDPVVRYLMLGDWREGPLPPELRAALLSDENEMVRARAAVKLRE